MLRRVELLWVSVLCAGIVGLSGTAQAGPVELLNGVSIDSSNAKNMVVPFAYGGNGIFVSQDGGLALKWLCSAGVAIAASNRAAVTFSSGDGHIYMGLFDSLLRGDPDGCNFQPVPEMDKKYIRVLAGDPIDPKRTYVATSNAMAENGIFVNDGGGTFVPLGSTATLFIDTLNVVKVGAARRFYETAVRTNVMTNEVKYSVRMSEDDGKTWTEEPLDPLAIDPEDKSGPELSIVAIDPQNPDRLIGLVSRRESPDSLIMSSEKGKAGSWKVIAKPTELGGVAFTPDGKLYFGDSDTMTRGMYVIESEGAEAKALSSCLRISCLTYDAAGKRLLGCGNNFLFGPIDTATGALKPLLDLRCTEHAVTCAQKPEIQSICQPPNVEFCKIDHWLLSPMCRMYDRGADFCPYAQSQSFHCAGGFAVSNDPPDPMADSCAGMINTGDPKAAGPDPVEEICGPKPGGAAGMGAPTAGMSAAAGSGSTTAGASAGAEGSSNNKADSGGAAGSTNTTGSSQKARGCSCTSVAGGARSNAWSTLLAIVFGMVAVCRIRTRFGVSRQS